MESVLLVIHLIVAVGIIAVVLIQPSEAGGFLGSSGSMSNMMMPRRGGDVLTRVTTGLAACFFVTSLLLAIVASNRPSHKSILDSAAPDIVKSAAEKQAAPTPAAAPEKKPADAKKQPAKKTETPKAPVAE